MQFCTRDNHRTRNLLNLQNEKKTPVTKDNDYFHYSPFGRILVTKTEGNVMSLSRLILGYADTKQMRHLLSYPSKLKIRQLYSAFLILEGKYAFSLL